MNNKEIQLLVFRIDSEQYAVDVLQVREIVRIKETTRIPKAHPYVKGAMNLRGQVIIVLDTAQMLGLGTYSEDEQNQKIIIIETLGTTFGALVDEVLGVISVKQDEIEEPTTVLENEESEGIKGLIKKDEQLITIIDLKGMIEKEFKSFIEKV